MCVFIEQRPEWSLGPARTLGNRLPPKGVPHRNIRICHQSSTCDQELLKNGCMPRSMLCDSSALALLPNTHIHTHTHTHTVCSKMTVRSAFRPSTIPISVIEIGTEGRRAAGLKAKSPGCNKMRCVCVCVCVCVYVCVCV